MEIIAPQILGTFVPILLLGNIIFDTVCLMMQEPSLQAHGGQRDGQQDAKGLALTCARCRMLQWRLSTGLMGGQCVN